MDPDALRDAPLFRELQRVMASSSGPINWELARQVGVASALEEGPDPEPTEEDRRMLDEAVRVAELQVAGFTGMELPGDIVHVQPVRRAEWVGASATSLRSLLEPAAQRMGQALEAAMREQMPEDLGPMAGMLTQLGPLLQGTQVGQVLGFLATAEGYADHVMHALGARLLATHAMIEEAMLRHREDEATDPVFERLLGIDMKREQYVAGRRFCDLVVDLTDEAILARMWGSAEAMPSLPEIEEPRLWLARTV